MSGELARRLRRRATAVALAAVALLPALVACRASAPPDAPAQPGPQQQPRSAPTGAPPPPAPGPAAAKAPAVGNGGTLAWTLGAWVGTRRDAAGGSEAPVTVRVTPILGGAGQTEEIEVRGARGVYRGFGTEAFDVGLGRWVMMYVNAVHGRFARYEGTAGEARIEWWPATPEPPHRSHLVWERPAPGRFRRTMSVSEDDGRSWRVLWTDELAAATPASPR